MKRRINLPILVGPVVSVAGLLTYFTWAARYPSLRDVPWPSSLVTLSGVALAVVGALRAYRHPAAYRGRFVGPVSLLVAAAATGLFHYYVLVLSARVPPESAVTASLRKAPAFALLDQDGKTVRLADYAGKKLVIVFYRGSW